MHLRLLLHWRRLFFADVLAALMNQVVHLLLLVHLCEVYLFDLTQLEL